MAQTNQGFYIPELPAIPRLGNLPTGASYDNVIKTIKSVEALPSLSSVLLPQAQNIFDMQGRFFAPQLAAVRERGEELAANAQSDAGARGLRGSDIEAAGMAGARLGALTEEGKMRGQFGMAQSQAFLDILTKAAMGDLEAAKELRLMLAQAMGQELGDQRSIEAARVGREFAASQGAKNRQAALIGAGISALGSLGGGAMKFSDASLKDDVERVGTVGKMDVVRYKATVQGQKLGMQDGVGLLAQQVAKHYPKAVGVKQGFMTVDYAKLPKKVRAEVAKLGGPRA